MTLKKIISEHIRFEHCNIYTMLSLPCTSKDDSLSIWDIFDRKAAH